MGCTESLLRLLVALTLMTGSCSALSGAGADDAERSALVVPPVGNDPGELIDDVQHLIGEAAADHDAGERVGAEQQWILATATFRAHLLEPIRANDKMLALHLEYDLGRFGDAVRRNGGKPAVQQKALNKTLESQRKVILAWYAQRAQPTQQP
jgi:hypothetical protein